MPHRSPPATVWALAKRFPELVEPIPPFRARGAWAEVPLDPVDDAADPAVPIGPFSDPPYDALLADPIYAAPFDDSPYGPDGMPGYPYAMFVRRSVADALTDVQEKVRPFGLRVLLYDALRDTRAQRSLFGRFLAEVHRLASEHGIRLSEAEASDYTCGMVAAPSTNPLAPAPHQVGAVDLVLVRLPPVAAAQLDARDEDVRTARPDRRPALEAQRLETWKDAVRSLDYGCAFDHGGPAAGARYLERAGLTTAEVAARDNRRVLFHLMTGTAGMAPVEGEYWHFDPPDSQIGVQVLGRGKATLGATRLTDADLAHAALVDDWYAQFGRRAAGRRTSLPTADAILPTAGGVLAYARRRGSSKV